MASPNILRQSKGFTLVEILITIVILVVILSFGLFISFDFYKNYSFRSEKNIIVSVLQKARNQSLDNIDQTRHGVHFAANPLQYIIYECPGNTLPCNYIANPSTDIVINSSYGITITNPSPLPFDVVFDQLNGDCVTPNCTLTLLIITISDGAKSYDISTNSEGRIDW